MVGAAPMSSRELILGRVRAALADIAADEPASWIYDRDADEQSGYARAGSRDREALVALFADRCGEYRATVTRAERSGLGGAIAAACARHGASSLIVPTDLPQAWRAPGVEWHEDRPRLDVHALSELDGALTGCAVGIALTGTIVLDAGEAQGRRALTLLPDLHICVIGEEQIVEGVPEAFERLAPAAQSGRPLTFISGPSATSDIELKRVEGVHGPRRLEIVIAG
jgi:L-lactate dehydrogenase complex protein LldG